MSCCSDSSGFMTLVELYHGPSLIPVALSILVRKRLAPLQRKKKENSVATDFAPPPSLPSPAKVTAQFLSLFFIPAPLSRPRPFISWPINFALILSPYRPRRVLFAKLSPPPPPLGLCLSPPPAPQRRRRRPRALSTQHVAHNTRTHIRGEKVTEKKVPVFGPSREIPEPDWSEITIR